MTKSSAFVLAAAGLAGLLLSPACLAATEEAMVWSESLNGSLASLAYGPSDAAKPPLFLLTCFSDLGIAVLDVRKELADAEPGQKLTIELSAGSAQAPLSGEVAKEESGAGLFAEASNIAVKPVLAVLGKEGPATVKIGPATADLSDQGRAAAVSKFSEDCKID